MYVKLKIKYMTKEEILNVFEKAGDLLYCDKIAVYDFHKNEGDCYLYYRKEKHIDEMIKDREKYRLFDMLRMGFDDTVGWVSFKDTGTRYDGEYDIIQITFELGIQPPTTEIK